jgi:hypothetical protein
VKPRKVPDDAGPREPAGFRPGVLERSQANEKVIKASMKRWRSHNEFGRSIGRGLSEAELVEKVAGETGASMTHVRHSLKAKD